MFVTTANTLNLPQPLLDRMEIIRLEGYTEDEKVEIAKRHLIAKQIEAHGLKEGEFDADRGGPARPDPLLHPRGGRPHARARDRQGRRARRCARSSKARPRSVDDHARQSRRLRRRPPLPPRHERGGGPDRRGHRPRLDRGRRRIADDRGGHRPRQGPDQDHRQARRRDAGVDPGRLLASSRRAAPSYGVKPSVFGRKDIHVHLPEGAVPKDGPSAGIGMVTAIISTLTGIPVRRDVAMTGEVTLRGRVLPIGGLKEKLLAALRGGITKVLIPAENEKDLAEIPANIKEGLEIVPVAHVDEVLAPGAGDAGRADRLDRGRRARRAAAGRARRAPATTGRGSRSATDSLRSRHEERRISRGIAPSFLLTPVSPLSFNRALRGRSATASLFKQGFGTDEQAGSDRQVADATGLGRGDASRRSRRCSTRSAAR